MKKVMIIILLVTIIFNFAYSDIDFQQRLDTAKTFQIIGWAGGVIGTLLTIASLTLIDPEKIGFTVWASVGVGLIGGGFGLGMFIGDEVKRWETALKYENTYTSAELKAIEERKIFIGMSEYALIASWGHPDKINRSAWEGGSSNQYVYRNSGKYVYVENNKITGWN